MPKPRPAIILNASRTVLDDLLDEKAWDYLNKISQKYRTEKMLHPLLASPRITVEEISQVSSDFKKEVSFPDAIKFLANQFRGSQRQEDCFPTKTQLDRFFGELRKTVTRLLATEETSPKVDALEKQLAGLLVEGQNLKQGVVGKWKTRGQFYVLGIGTVPGDWLMESTPILSNLRECLYRYYTDEERCQWGLEIDDRLLGRFRLSRVGIAKSRKQLRINLEMLLPEIDQAEKQVKSHPYYRNGRRANWRSCFCLIDVEEVFKRYGLPVEYIEYNMANKPIREQKNFLDYGLEDKKPESAIRYHKSEYYRCVQIILQYGGHDVDAIHCLRECCNKSSL